MTYNFKDIYVSREKRFALGKELSTGKYYICFPVKYFVAEYDEYYEISEYEFSEFFINPDNIFALLERARKRLEDSRHTFFEIHVKRGFPT